MMVSEILQEVGRARDLYYKGLRLKDTQAIAESLEISLKIRKYIDSSDRKKLEQEIEQFYHLDGGLNAHIFNCMKLAGFYEGIIPYLERTLEYLDNNRNPDLWRQLGLLYLTQEENLDKACIAWKKAIELQPMLIDRYPGLNVVFVYESLKSSGKTINWTLLHANLETGEFAVRLSESE